MDLSPYICKGFGPYWDAALVKPDVGGVDADHCRGTVRVCDETMDELYNGDYSPKRIKYQRGSRPVLEMIVSPWRALPEREKTARAMAWVHQNVPHRNIVSDIAVDRAMTEEQLIQSRVAWCNEQARVLVALCAVMDIPGRMCFLFHENGKAGHACSEIFIEGKWVFHDVTYNLRIELPDGTLATGAELSGPYRRLLRAPYEPAALRFVSRYKPYANPESPEESARKDQLFHQIGVSNYVCDGVEVVEPAMSRAGARGA